MTAENNHLDDLLHSALLWRNCAGDFALLRVVDPRSSQLADSLHKTVTEIFDFIAEVKISENLERNYFLIKWLRIADDFVDLEKFFAVADFLSEKQKQDAQKMLLDSHKIFVRDAWEALLISIGADKAGFVKKAAVLL